MTENNNQVIDNFNQYQPVEYWLMKFKSQGGPEIDLRVEIRMLGWDMVEWDDWGKSTHGKTTHPLHCTI